MADEIPNSLSVFVFSTRNHFLCTKILIQDLEFLEKLQKFRPNSTLNKLVPAS
jgi:hypothetical protein